MAQANTISITINDGSTTKQVTNIPWFPGITVLQAMVLGQAMNPGTFSFRVVYHSFFGAFVDMMDDVADASPQFWMFSVSNNPSPVGVSEAILLESGSGQNVDIEWSFQIPDGHPASKSQGTTKQKLHEKK